VTSVPSQHLYYCSFVSSAQDAIRDADDFREATMPKPYSDDLRARVIEAVAAGASRREVAERYDLSASIVVLWAQRWEETGSVGARSLMISLNAACGDPISSSSTGRRGSRKQFLPSGMVSRCNAARCTSTGTCL
jgi:Homeodomain-like domain